MTTPQIIIKETKIRRVKKSLKLWYEWSPLVIRVFNPKTFFLNNVCISYLVTIMINIIIIIITIICYPHDVQYKFFAQTSTKLII